MSGFKFTLTKLSFSHTCALKHCGVRMRNCSQRVWHWAGLLVFGTWVCGTDDVTRHTCHGGRHTCCATWAVIHGSCLAPGPLSRRLAGLPLLPSLTRTVRASGEACGDVLPGADQTGETEGEAGGEGRGRPAAGSSGWSTGKARHSSHQRRANGGCYAGAQLGSSRPALSTGQPHANRRRPPRCRRATGRGARHHALQTSPARDCRHARGHSNSGCPFLFGH